MRNENELIYDGHADDDDESSSSRCGQYDAGAPSVDGANETGHSQQEEASSS